MTITIGISWHYDYYNGHHKLAFQEYLDKEDNNFRRFFLLITNIDERIENTVHF